MISKAVSPNYEQNAILASLSARAYKHLKPHLETVNLETGQNLYNCGDKIRYLYFPLDSVFCLFTTMEDGATIETGIIGSEGVLGISSVFGAENSTFQARPLTKNKVARISSGFLKKEFDSGGSLRNLLLRYFHTLHVQVSQTAACNRHHKMEGRLCRWLLMMHDRSKSNELKVTQEFIAEMLGTRRPYITTAAGVLQKEGIIKCGRGRIKILDRRALENSCCECYQIIRREFENMNLRRASSFH